jgi:hypothetical protein
MFTNIRVLFLMLTCKSSPCDVDRCLPITRIKEAPNVVALSQLMVYDVSLKHNNVLSLCMNSHNAMLYTLTDTETSILCSKADACCVNKACHLYLKIYFTVSHCSFLLLFTGFSYQCVFLFEILAKHTPLLRLRRGVARLPESWGQWDSKPRMTVLTRPSSNLPDPHVSRTNILYTCI